MNQWVIHILTHIVICAFPQWIGMFEETKWTNDSGVFPTKFLSRSQSLLLCMSVNKMNACLNKSDEQRNYWLLLTCAVICIIPEWIGVFLWSKWTNDLVNQWILYKSVYLNKLLYINDSVTHSYRWSCIIPEWISGFEWIRWTNNSLTHSHIQWFVSEWTGVSEKIE